MTDIQKLYFDNMLPGAHITTTSVKDPDALIKAGKEYIDQGGFAYFSDDYSEFVKEDAWVPVRHITILVDGLPLS